jgi:hypothetical protein
VQSAPIPRTEFAQNSLTGRRPSAFRFGGSVIGVLLSGALLFGGCSASQTTTGKRVALTTRATADQAELKSGFDTSLGWHVDLKRAAVAFDSFYYFDGEPAFVHNTRPSRLPSQQPPLLENSVDRLLQFLGEGVAHAHPGHYQAGNARGQMLVPGSVDLFAENTVLGDGSGVTGTYRSGRFTFADRVVGSAAKTLGQHVAVVEGSATRLGSAELAAGPVEAGTADAGSAAPVIHFRLFADYADLSTNVTNGEIDGCEFKAAEVQGDGAVTLTFKPSIWFDLVDFSAVAPGSEEEPTEVAQGDIAQLGFALGLVQLTGYQFSFSD